MHLTECVWLALLILLAIGVGRLLDNAQTAHLYRRIASPISYEGLVTVSNALESSTYLRWRLRCVLTRCREKNRLLILRHIRTDMPGRASKAEVMALYRFVLLVDPRQKDVQAEIALAFQIADNFRHQLGWSKEPALIPT